MQLRALILLFATTLSTIGAPALRIVKESPAAKLLLHNGNFEEAHDGKLAGWRPWQEGYRVEPTGGRGGSHGILCARSGDAGQFGASQTLTLNRTETAPLIVRGWSKAEEVSGSPDSGYALYLDLVYADDTPLWGQVASFSCGTHDWEKRELVLLPDKPVKSVTLHCLFRGHTGKAWFDDVVLEEAPHPAGATLFQGVAIQKPQTVPPSADSAARSAATADGLRLGLRGNDLVSMQLDRQELANGAPGGFIVRDFAANSDFHTFNGEMCPELGLKIQADFTSAKDHIAVSGRVMDLRGRDRAITLLFALPVDASGWQWGDDMRSHRPIEGSGEFANTGRLPGGANGQMSLYPLAAIWNERAGLALGLDMEHPSQSRLVYHAGTKQFFVAYDFGLAPETQPAPGSAEFRFVVFRFEPRWGFRAALQRFYEIFPEHFRKRVAREGNWMPFTDIAKVPGFEDFHFGFQEGASNVPFDDKHRIASFIYVEPMSHWLAMPPEAPRTYPGALQVLEQDRSGARGPSAQHMAAATLSSGIYREDGRYALHIEKAPWCDGGVFLLNPDPNLTVSTNQPYTKATVMRTSIDAAFRKNPGDERSPGSGLDGVYLDSFEMGAGELNYRREHFATGRSPLVFDRDGRPCQLLVFSTWQFARETGARLHADGKLLFANAVLWRFGFPAALLDVLGTEVNWLSNGKYVPDTDAVMNFRRALCGQKPYCLLMNTDYSRFTPELVERYFQRCLFYGVWPSFFDEAAASKDPYWASKKQWYERDRPLFKRYMPLFDATTSAGWQAIPHATCDNPHLWVERFGPDAQGTVFYAVFNDTTAAQAGVLTPDLAAIGTKGKTSVVEERISGRTLERSGTGWRMSLPPQTVALVRITTTP